MKSKLRTLYKTLLKIITISTGLLMVTLSGAGLLLGQMHTAGVALLVGCVLFANAFYGDLQ